jgi:hypothetical protein
VEVFKKQRLHGWLCSLEFTDAAVTRRVSCRWEGGRPHDKWRRVASHHVTRFTVRPEKR